MRSTVNSPAGQAVYLTARHPVLSRNNPVYRFDFAKRDAQLAARHLRAFGASGARGTLALASPAIRAGAAQTRITLTLAPPPAYEQRATGYYVRGTAISVQAGDSSCNIVCTGPGAIALADALVDGASKAKQVVHVVVERGNGKRDDMVHVIPDLERAAATAERDSDRLAAAGPALAALVWGEDDFSDWENP
jgi:hypothetical protein